MRPMRRYAFVLALICSTCVFSSAARALDKVDPYICPTQTQGSGIDCFLEAVPQTYTMCRHVKSIEIIEFGLTGAQEGVNGAKTESCIDKHRLLITRPYQAALRESANNKETVQGLRKLYDSWLDSLAKLIPTAADTDEGYKQRVVLPYANFTEQIKMIRASAEAPAKSAPKTGSKPNQKAAK